MGNETGSSLFCKKKVHVWPKIDVLLVTMHNSENLNQANANYPTKIVFDNNREFI